MNGREPTPPLPAPPMSLQETPRSDVDEILRRKRKAREYKVSFDSARCLGYSRVTPFQAMRLIVYSHCRPVTLVGNVKLSAIRMFRAKPV